MRSMTSGLYYGVDLIFYYIVTTCLLLYIVNPWRGIGTTPCYYKLLTHYNNIIMSYWYKLLS